MRAESNRFVEALQLLHAAIAVAVYGSVAEGKQPVQAFSLSRIVPLEQEFSDVFSRRRFIVDRLCKALRRDKSYGHLSNLHLEEKGLWLLRNTTVMPSTAIRALAKRLNTNIHPPRTSLRLRHCQGTSAVVARELNCDEQFVRWCWQHDHADLDKQWKLLRNELLKIRAEIEEGLI